LWLDNFLGGAVGKRVECLNMRRCIFSWEEIGFVMEHFDFPGEEKIEIDPSVELRYVSVLRQF
jgi:hypothetical protein